MSALAGLWHFDAKPAGEACERMLVPQAMYGRDGNACWDGGDVALGRRLFRTLPEDMHDAQPLRDGEERFVLVADVRFDNRGELIDALNLPRERARTMCDAALLLRAWERWGEALFAHIVGDYAFALWDAAERRLILARDPLGQRPLHYHRGATCFAFASMPKGLHALPDIPRASDEVRVAEFLALMPEYGTRSFFDGIERIEPGHVAVVTRSGMVSRPHWSPPCGTLRLASAEDYAEGLRHHLDAAVQARLRSPDAALGAHLSAGLDSGAVAATAARLLAGEGRTLTAFTAVPRRGYAGVDPPGRIIDEGPLAALTAADHSNIDHVLVGMGARKPTDGLDRDFFLYDRPVLNICNGMWLAAINDAARSRGLSVMLTGQNGNLGLSHDGVPLLPELIAQGRWLRCAKEAVALVRRGHRSWRGAIADAIGPFVPPAAWKAAMRMRGRSGADMAVYSALNPQLRDRLARSNPAGHDVTWRPRRVGGQFRLRALRHIDMGNYNKGILAGWGLDMRDPTADTRLLEYCLSVPEDQFLVDGETKALARRALADRLPPHVVGARSRGFQGADWHERLEEGWGDLEREVARLADCAPAGQALDVDRMQALLRAPPPADWQDGRVAAQYRMALLRGVSVGHFIRKAGGSNA